MTDEPQVPFHLTPRPSVLHPERMPVVNRFQRRAMHNQKLGRREQFSNVWIAQPSRGKRKPKR